jgi:hypothetical protein
MTTRSAFSPTARPICRSLIRPRLRGSESRWSWWLVFPTRIPTMTRRVVA